MTRGISIALLGASLALSVACKSDDRDQAGDQARAAADRAAVEARTAAGKARETVAKAVDTVGEQTGPAGETIDQGVEAAKQRIEAGARATGEAYDRARTELSQDRATFTDRAAERLRALDAEIADLEARAKPRADRASDVAVAKLRQLRNDASAALERARKGTEQAWEAAKPSIEAGLLRAESALAETRAALGPADGTAESPAR